MKRLIISMAICLMLMATAASAASNVIIDKVGGVTLHTYQSDDPLGDVSILIESDNELVVLEPQAFAKNIDELAEYAEGLNKPITTVLVSYHAGGMKRFEKQTTITTKAMDGFMGSDAAKGMLGYFDKAFKGGMDTRVAPFSKVIENTSVVMIDGVEYRFSPTNVPGMPGSNIAINGKALYQHFAPTANMHASEHLIKSKASIEGALKDAEEAKTAGYELFLASHLPGHGTVADLEFQIAYLKTLKSVAASAKSKEDVINGMNKAYPDCKGEANLKAYAKNLFK